MKRYLLIFTLLLGAVCSYAQSATDQALVLQKCLDLPDLQQYYPMAPDQSREQVYVVKNASAFSSEMQLNKFGKPVIFINSDKQVENQTVAYFVFRKFTISGNQANAEFDFYYTLTRFKALFKCTVVLNKTGNVWTVADTKLTGGKL